MSKNQVDLFFDRFKNHRILKWIFIIGIILVSILTLYEKISNFFTSKSTQPTVVNIETNYYQEDNTNISPPQSTAQKNQDSPVKEKTPPLQKKPAKKLKIILVVNSEFSEGRIYVNGKETIPIENSLTIKKLEVDYEEEIHLLVESAHENITCSKKAKVREDQKEIKLFCG